MPHYYLVSARSKPIQIRIRIHFLLHEAMHNIPYFHLIPGPPLNIRVARYFSFQAQASPAKIICKYVRNRRGPRVSQVVSISHPPASSLPPHPHPQLHPHRCPYPPFTSVPLTHLVSPGFSLASPIISIGVKDKGGLISKCHIEQ